MFCFFFLLWCWHKNSTKDNGKNIEMCSIYSIFFLRVVLILFHTQTLRQSVFLSLILSDRLPFFPALRYFEIPALCVTSNKISNCVRKRYYYYYLDLRHLDCSAWALGGAWTGKKCNKRHLI